MDCISYWRDAGAQRGKSLILPKLHEDFLRDLWLRRCCQNTQYTCCSARVHPRKVFQNGLPRKEVEHLTTAIWMQKYTPSHLFILLHGCKNIWQTQGRKNLNSLKFCSHKQRESHRRTKALSISPQPCSSNNNYYLKRLYFCINLKGYIFFFPSSLCSLTYPKYLHKSPVTVNMYSTIQSSISYQVRVKTEGEMSA